MNLHIRFVFFFFCIQCLLVMKWGMVVVDWLVESIQGDINKFKTLMVSREWAARIRCFAMAKCSAPLFCFHVIFASKYYQSNHCRINTIIHSNWIINDYEYIYAERSCWGQEHIFYRFLVQTTFFQYACTEKYKIPFIHTENVVMCVCAFCCSKSIHLY